MAFPVPLALAALHIDLPPHKPSLAQKSSRHVELNMMMMRHLEVQSDVRLLCAKAAMHGSAVLPRINMHYCINV